MRNPKRHVRFVLRAVAIALVVVGAVLMSSWFEVLFQTTVEGASAGGSSIASAEALRALPWAVPALLVGLVLLVATRKREQQLVSLTGRVDDA